MCRTLRDYVVYKGDSFIDLGNVKELAKRLGIKEKTLYWLSTEAAHKRAENTDNILVYKIEEGNDEE